MNAILALDQGTTSSRAIVFDHAGNVVSQAQREITQFFPQPGWVEHDATEIWQTQLAVAVEAVDAAAKAGFNVCSVGITNQRETTVLWDRASGVPLAPAIVWQDRRTAGFCDALKKDGHEPEIAEKTGLVVDAYFSGTKLKWLLDQIPGARERAARSELAFGTIDSWLIWNLTGSKPGGGSRSNVHATDVSNASRTLLFNIHRLDWDDELLALMDIPRAVLPNIVSSSGVVGRTTCEGLPTGLPIAGIAGDQQAALFGQACHQPGMAKNTYGTGCFMLMNTGERPVVSKNRLLTTVAWRLDPPHGSPRGSSPSQSAAPGGSKPSSTTHYALEGSVFMGGATIQWLRDGLGIIEKSSDVEALAASVADTGGAYVVPAFAGLGAPHWDSTARGAILGLTRGSTRGHIARAAVESIAFQSAELAAAMQRDAGIALTELRADGGASTNNMLMQFQADLLGISVVRPRITETTALGAAYLAGLAIGFWQSQQEIAALWTRDRTFTPTLTSDAANTQMRGWLKAIEKSKGFA